MSLLKKLFHKVIKAKPYTVYHPDIKDKVIPSIKWNGIQYYKYKDDLDVMYGRYMYMATFMQAIEMRMSLPTLNSYLDDLDNILAGTKGSINVGNAIIIIKQMKTRTNILFDEELALNLASCVFFTDDEPLDTYSMERNKIKIEAWRTSPLAAFFMQSPVRTLLGLTNISESDLKTYLETSRPMIEELNKVMHKAMPKESTIR